MQKPSASPQDTIPPGRTGRFMRAACWGGAITFLLCLGLLFLRGRGRMVNVDETTLATAQQQWQQANIEDYDLEIEISERQQRRYRIEIRNAKISALWHNDRPIKEPHRYRAWTIPGMFQTIRTDVKQQRQPASSTNPATSSNLTIRVEFDSTYGFPRRYIRIEHRRQGDNPEISWKVISFTPQG